MSKEEIGVDIPLAELPRSKTNNMFTKVLGPKYAKRFREVYDASLDTRDEKMMDLYDESKNDESLTADQKRIIAACYLGFKEAVGYNNISTPIIAYVVTKHPVLSKGFKNKSRIHRTLDHLNDLCEKTGFNFEAYHFPGLINAFNSQFRKSPAYRPNEDDGVEEMIITTAFSMFARSCGPLSYANKWYAAYYMRNIGLLAYLPPHKLAEDPDLIKRIENIMKTNTLICLLEYKRSGAIEDNPNKADEKKKSNQFFDEMASKASNPKDALSVEINRQISELAIDMNNNFEPPTVGNIDLNEDDKS